MNYVLFGGMGHCRYHRRDIHNRADGTALPERGLEWRDTSVGMKLTPGQRDIVRELRKEIRGEKEMATTPAEAALLLVAIAEEIQALHREINNQKGKLQCGTPIPHYGPL